MRFNGFPATFVASVPKLLLNHSPEAILLLKVILDVYSTFDGNLIRIRCTCLISVNDICLLTERSCESVQAYAIRFKSIGYEITPEPCNLFTRGSKCFYTFLTNHIKHKKICRTCRTGDQVSTEITCLSSGILSSYGSFNAEI